MRFMKKFFFDTANISHINSTWEYLKQNGVKSSLVAGITTNPNAFFKINKLSLSEWVKSLPFLCETISKIRGDDRGIVYIQGPSSQMSPDEVLKYVDYISPYTDGQTKLGLKIPPFKNILNIVNEIYSVMDTNVTGVSDCATALKAMSYNINYMSIIPGRMEEVGIDAKEQIAFINSSNRAFCEIIAGSMRTIDQLIWTFQYKTVPTIGEKVWNKIIEEKLVEKLLNIDYNINIDTKEFSPTITSTNYSLTEAFFKQMDECGKVAYEDFKKLS